MSTTRTTHPQRYERMSLRLAAVLAATVLGACGPAIEVRTAAAPEASALAGRHTFSVVEASDEPNGSAYGIPDPIIENSITSRAVADQVVAAFEARGYRYQPDNADFIVTYKATVAPVLDIRSYDFGGYGTSAYHPYYGYSAYSPGYCCYDDGFGHAVASYDRSTVIIDAIDPKSNELLWRGQGIADGYTSPKKYMKDLRHAVHAIAKKFPTSMTPGVVAYR